MDNTISGALFIDKDVNINTDLFALINEHADVNDDRMEFENIPYSSSLEELLGDIMDTEATGCKITFISFELGTEYFIETDHISDCTEASFSIDVSLH